jgi:hypothetical protein
MGVVELRTAIPLLLALLRSAIVAVPVVGLGFALAALCVDILARFELLVARVLARLGHFLAGIRWTVGCFLAGVELEWFPDPVGVDVVASATGRGNSANMRLA